VKAAVVAVVAASGAIDIEVINTGGFGFVYK